MSNKWGRFALHMNSLRPAMQLGLVPLEQYEQFWDAVCELLHLSQDEILFEIDRHWDPEQLELEIHVSDLSC